MYSIERADSDDRTLRAGITLSRGTRNHNKKYRFRNRNLNREFYSSEIGTGTETETSKITLYVKFQAYEPKRTDSGTETLKIFRPATLISQKRKK